ncbi:alpha/beta fold hydrolase [Actinomycetes bacterium KLBMP 9797]
MLTRRLLTCVLVTLTLIATTPSNAVATRNTTGFTTVDIASHDGVVLKANVIAPTTAGPHPAVVFISSWGLNDAEYLAQARAMAEAGYVVLSYTARGFWSSGGEIETAGPADVADVSAVIDWLVARTAADPDRIGVGGISYGAGIGLLAAGHDARIRAVAAMSGWTDLIESLYADQTRHPQAVWLLAATARLLGRPSAEFDRIVGDYFANRNVAAIRAWGAVRSAQTYVDGIKRNGPAVLLANAYGDSVFGPNQLVGFFGALTGPKRLELAPGDHAIPELTGLAGLPNHVWTSTRSWFDQYLAGVDTGIDDDPVVLRVRNAGGAVEAYRDWADVTGSTVRYHLGSGELATTAATGWTERFWAVGDTVAGAGVVLLTNGLEALTGTPPLAWLPAVDRTRGAVWRSAPLARGVAVRGIPRLRLTVTPAAASGTVIAYLYDVDALGTGQLIAHAPYTWLSDGRQTIDLALPATAWNVAAGHRLALVVDTEDPLYLDANEFGAAITVIGPSWVDVPLR